MIKQVSRFREIKERTSTDVTSKHDPTDRGENGEHIGLPAWPEILSKD